MVKDESLIQIIKCKVVGLQDGLSFKHLLIILPLNYAVYRLAKIIFNLFQQTLLSLLGIQSEHMSEKHY